VQGALPAAVPGASLDDALDTAFDLLLAPRATTGKRSHA
jgi:hypothetical protein